MRRLLLLALPLCCGFDWGTLPGELERTPIDSHATSDGKRVFMELRRAKARPEDVLSYCLGQFQRAGLHVPKLSRQLQGPGPSLTALDVETRTSYSVSVMDKGGGVVEVILGGAMHSARREAESDWPPAHPAAKAAVRSSSEGARSVTFRSALKAAEVETWYAQELERAGFTRAAGGFWEKGTARVFVHVGTQGAESLVTATAQGDGPKRRAP